MEYHICFYIPKYSSWSAVNAVLRRPPTLISRLFFTIFALLTVPGQAQVIRAVNQLSDGHPVAISSSWILLSRPFRKCDINKFLLLR